MLRISAVCAVALGLPAVAWGQDQDGGLDAHGFVLTAQDGDVRDGYVLHRPGAMDRGQWFVGGVLELANRPLVLIDASADPDDPSREPALTNVLGLNLTGGATLHPRVRLTASMPLFFTSRSFGENQGLAAGDLRLDAMLLAVTPEDELGVGLGLVPWIDLPTGATSKFLGRPGIGGGGVVAMSYGFPRATVTANLGAQFDPEVEGLLNLTGSDALISGLGANVLVTERDALGIELDVLSPLRANDRKGAGAPAELTVSFRHRTESGPYFNAGFAAPVSRGAGAAAWRLFLGGGFGKLGPAAPKDKDLDGITDDLDACPTEPEVVNGYRDEDGCPDGLSTLLVDVTWNGAPVAGADLIVEAADGTLTEAATTAQSWSAAATPDSTYKLTAKKGDCLVGDTTARVGDGESRAAVPLVLVASATVKVSVVDSSGNPIDGARLAWETDTPECLPAEPPALTRGASTIELGPGKHTFIVSAPNYRIAEQVVDVNKGADEALVFELAPTKLKLEKSRIVILEKVQFETNKATIKPESFELLDEVADIINRNPGAGRVEVQDHTDDRGSDSYNLELSQRRAESVRRYLADHGVDKDRLIAVGFGETKPIADNGTAAGRAENRRVEFLLIDQKDQAIEEPAH